MLQGFSVFVSLQHSLMAVVLKVLFSRNKPAAATRLECLNLRVPVMRKVGNIAVAV
jgi:hypothetical protein